jgi:hypothetical protein
MPDEAPTDLKVFVDLAMNPETWLLELGGNERARAGKKIITINLLTCMSS